MVVEVSDNGEIQMQTRVTRLWNRLPFTLKKCSIDGITPGRDPSRPDRRGCVWIRHVYSR